MIHACAGARSEFHPLHDILVAQPRRQSAVASILRRHHDVDCGVLLIGANHTAKIVH
jgi:hypothetical protein